MCLDMTRKDESMKEIIINKQKLKVIPIVPTEDYYASEDGDIYSMRSGKFIKQKNGKSGYKTFNVHRGSLNMTVRSNRAVASAWIGELDGSKEVDHIDGDKANNCVSNLRIVTRAENQRGFQSKRSDTSSRYRGVSLHKKSGRWGARIKFGTMRIRCGLHGTEEEAALAWNRMAKKLGFSNEAMNQV